MTSLSEFLLARIAEDEAAARRVHAERCDTPAETVPDSMGRPMSPVCDCDWHIARVLADCAAKRRIVELHEPYDDGAECWVCAFKDGAKYGDGWGGEAWPCETLRALASAYASHPGYREEWT